MSDAGAFRYPGNLDPTAQEFIPGNTKPIPFFTPASVFFPYASPPPAAAFPHLPIPPPPPPQYHPNELRFLPFYPPLPPPPQQLEAAPAPLLPPTSAAPTRAVVLISVAADVGESAVRRDLEVFGEVRGVQMERVHEGIVTVHFYDLRNAQTALTEIRERHMQQQFRFSAGVDGLDFFPAARGFVSGRAVWAHYVIPVSNAVPEGNNQGTLVIMNLEPKVSSAALQEIFQVYGNVKELRETPYKRHQRFVEFYDVRDAAKALREMNGREIHGKPVVIQFSRPGGFSKRLFLTSQQYNKHLHSHHSSSPSPRDFSGHHRRFPHFSLAKPPAASYRMGSTVPLASLAALSLRDEADKLGSETAKNYVKNSESSSNDQKLKQPQQQLRNNNNGKYSKNRHTKKLRDACFVINEDAVADSGGCRDDRTTLMIKNIPNKYSQQLLLNMLDNHCIHCNEDTTVAVADNMPVSSYDFVYLPIDFNNKCNVGYGFVNMTSPQAAWRLYKAFHRQHWEVFNSRKICEVTYARVQGLEALKEHFKNSKFPCEMEQYMPVVFSPPRDGRRLTEPVPIVDIVRQVSGTDDDDDDSNLKNDGGDACGSCRADKTLMNRFDGCCGVVSGGGSENGGVLDHDEDDGCYSNDGFT